MGHQKIGEKIWESFWISLKEKGCKFSSEDVAKMTGLIKDEMLYAYVDSLISHVETILEIDPALTEKEIVQALLKSVVEYLKVDAATIRIVDPEGQTMILYGAYPEEAADWPEVLPLENTVTGLAFKARQVYFIPNVLQEEKFKYKERAEKLGIHSMLAIPISVPRFSLKDIDAAGILNLYFREKGREFTPLEIKIAETFSRRVGYVIARKRIKDLQQLNEAKDRIFEQIFLKLGRREGVKMKEVFDLVIPELAGIMKIQRCSLFSLMEDQQHVIMEAGYPEAKHGIGAIFSVQEPYIDALVDPKGPFGDFAAEEIHPDYILVRNPKGSRLLSPTLKTFLESQGIHSVLYIPLRVQEALKYFLVFDAESRHQKFTRETIEIFTFLGKELMKGLRLEKMDDIVHDFKNPAIAAAGFARRARKMLQDGDFQTKPEKIFQYLDIICQETSRIQDLALTLYGEGKEKTIDLADRLKKRFLINAEAVQELRREKIRLDEGSITSPLLVQCFPLHMDRVLDNLLNNATQAIPEEGGALSIGCYRQDLWAVAEITNTGQISEQQKEQALQGEAKGRGLQITTRLVKLMGGKMEVIGQGGQTTFRILLPMAEASRV